MISVFSRNRRKFIIEIELEKIGNRNPSPNNFVVKGYLRIVHDNKP